MEGSFERATHKYPLTLIIYCDFKAARDALDDQNIYPKSPSNFKVRPGVAVLRKLRFPWRLVRNFCRIPVNRLVDVAPGGVERRAGRRRARGAGGLTPGLEPRLRPSKRAHCAARERRRRASITGGAGRGRPTGADFRRLGAGQMIAPKPGRAHRLWVLPVNPIAVGDISSIARSAHFPPVPPKRDKAR
jgi:hypothetical protein